MQAMPMTGPDADAMERLVLVPSTPPGPTALYLIRTLPGRRDEIMARVENELESRQAHRFINQTGTLAVVARQIRAPAHASAVILAVVAFLVVAVTALGIFGLAAFT
jgi:putative ABC transport system permease protein